MSATALCAASSAWLAGQNAPLPEKPGEVVELAAFSVTGLREKGVVPKNSAAGTKTVIPLVELPQSISVITADQIAIQGAQGIDDAVRYSSGITAAIYGFDPRSDWLYIRGFEPTRHIDGLATPDGTWTGASRWESYGFERVEVLKGASSALYGKMPPGGLINASTKRPTRDFLGEIGFTCGSYNQKQATLDFSGPLNPNRTLLYRITGLLRESETISDYSRDDRQFIATALTWLVTPDTWVTLLARCQHASSNGAGGFLPTQGTLTANPNGVIPIERYTGEPDYDYYKKNMWSAGYEFEHRFSAQWSLRQNLRHTRAKVAHDIVGPNGLLPDLRTLTRYTYTPHETSDTTAIDTQLNGRLDTGPFRHEILAGLDYRHSKNDYTSGYDGSAEDWGSTPSIDIFNPVYGAPVTSPAISTHEIPRQNQYGLYLQERLRLQNWLLTAGARQDFVNTRTGYPLTPGTLAQDDDKLTARAGLNYLFDNGLAPHIAWSTSFQPAIGTDSHGAPLQPAKGSVVEAGLKYQPKNTNALLTLAAYTSTLRNIKTQDGQTFQVEQQGKTRVEGIEAEARYSPLHGLDLIAAYTRTRSEIKETNDTQALGKRIPLVPLNQLSLWAGHTLSYGPLAGLGAGIGFRYRGALHGDAANEWRTASVILWDAVLHYGIAGWRVQVNAGNLFDKRYISVVNTINWAYYGNPRVITGSVSRRF
ncbi:MAG: TonB-dependent siderophore receptor [Opitutaceae bacterium]|nr:TonB-dependent siderophore receptor [Opitutaceae bacterium]